MQLIFYESINFFLISIVEALKNINLSFEKGTFISIVGPSGSGKVIIEDIDISQLNDEKCLNLDSKTTNEVINLLKTCVNEFGQTLIMITYNDEIAKVADKCIKIQDGMVI